MDMNTIESIIQVISGQKEIVIQIQWKDFGQTLKSGYVELILG